MIKQIIRYIRTPPPPHYNVENVHDFPLENAFVKNVSTQHCFGGAGVCSFSVMKKLHINFVDDCIYSIIIYDVFLI